MMDAQGAFQPGIDFSQVEAGRGRAIGGTSFQRRGAVAVSPTG